MNEQNISQLNESATKGSKHIWITVVAVIVTAIVVSGGIYVWQRSNLQSMELTWQQQVADLQNQIDDLQQSSQPVVTTPKTTQQPTQPANSIASWKTYTDKKNIFTIKYPAYWESEVISPTTVSTDPNTNEQVYFGTVKFSGHQGYLKITYGDGFGGGSCALFGGKLETFTINQKEVNLCYKKLENTTHSWRNNCSDCLVINLSNSKLTSYVFTSELNLPYKDAYSFLGQILSTFRVPD